MVCLGFKPGTVVWQALTNPLSNGGPHVGTVQCQQNEIIFRSHFLALKMSILSKQSKKIFQFLSFPNIFSSQILDTCLRKQVAVAAAAAKKKKINDQKSFTFKIDIDRRRPKHSEKMDFADFPPRLTLNKDLCSWTQSYKDFQSKFYATINFKQSD